MVTVKTNFEHRMKELIFATNNEHKLREVKEILKDKYIINGLADLNYHDELEENGNTFEENALQKAQFVANKFKISCFAEDAGLEVFALNNAPGVYSARYAGVERSAQLNNALLLKNLIGVEERGARFKAVISLCMGDQVQFFEGIVNGTISKQAMGTGGFGYDPIFIPDGFDKSFAELKKEIKNKISHRSQAVNKLISYLSNLT